MKPKEIALLFIVFLLGVFYGTLQVGILLNVNSIDTRIIQLLHLSKPTTIISPLPKAVPPVIPTPTVTATPSAKPLFIRP